MSEKRFTTDYSDLLKNDKTFIKMDNERLTYEEIVDLLNELNDENNELEKENEKLKKWLLLYDEDEVDKYLRTHPMPTTTITNKRKAIPLNMRHKRY